MEAGDLEQEGGYDERRASMPSELQRQVRARISDLLQAEQSQETNIKKVTVQELEGVEACTTMFFNFLFAVLCCPCFLSGATSILGQREIMVFEAYGKVIDTRNKPGCMFYPKVCCVD